MIWMTRFEFSSFEDELLELRIGDTVFFNGTVFTARDEAHKRMLDWMGEGKSLPFDLSKGVIYHCGPLIKEVENGWEVIAAGPTTSGRMNDLTPPLLNEIPFSAIVGKGGMNEKVTEALKGRCVYLAYTGGCAAVTGEFFKVKDLFWGDLGMPEAVWELECTGFGPLVVAVDAHGGDLYSDVRAESLRRFKEIVGDV